MFEQLKSRKWLTCGLIVLVIACVGLVISLGGLAAIGVLFGEPTATSQPVAVDSQPTSDSSVLPTNTAVGISDSAQPTPAASLRPIPFESVVQIVAMYYDENNRLVEGWTGSGSVISPDGLILTNAHVVLPDRYFPVDALVVAFTVAEDQPPQKRYYAEVLQADEQLDIAVIQITADLNQVPVDHASLNLPYVPLGNADNLRLGDQVTILGYPGIGGVTITLTRGEVSGFTSESGRGARAFIKTSATIAGGNSGGLAADPQGYLIGIPTQLGYGGDDQFVDCRVLADTNRDGYVDDRDNCVPTGGFINALRPINLALPLIEAARAGVVAVHQAGPVETVQAELPPEGSIIYQDDFSTAGGDWAWQGSEGSVTYVSAELHVEVSEQEYFIWSVSGQSYSDVLLEVDTRVVTAAGDGDFGLICRYQDNQNFYGMEISEDGYYAVWKMIDGEFYPLVDWQFSSLIDTSNPLHLGAACVGNSLALIVDGQLLAEVKDSDLSRGDAGLLVGTWEISPLVVSFDNFVVRSPEK
jgi:S1-C subfamily serine protease